MDITFLKSAFEENHYPPPNKPEMAFAGRSNVGKSSLINVLAGRKGIARTSSKPGRTQALNFFLVDNRFYWVDLPGYGYARVPVKVKRSWGSMVETYLRKRTNLTAVIVILDIRRDPTEGDRDLLNWLIQYGLQPLLILTKADKLSRHQIMSRTNVIANRLVPHYDHNPIVFSAKTGQGKQEIWEKIIQSAELWCCQDHRS